MNVVSVNGRPAEVGCYIPSHYGHLVPEKMADLVEEFGIEVPLWRDPRVMRANHDFEHQWSAFRRLLKMLNDAMDDDEDAEWVYVDGGVYLQLREE